MVMSDVLKPRSIRPAAPPLGLYIRPGRNDQKLLLDVIAAGHTAFSGAVLEATRLTRQSELLSQLSARRLETILDPLTQQSALPGSFTDEIGALPWVAGGIQSYDQLVAVDGQHRIASLASIVIEHKFSAVISPSHFLESAFDRWLEIDVNNTKNLRTLLDRSNRRTHIIYSLATPYSIFRDQDQRNRIIEALNAVPMNALRLKIDGLGMNSTASAIRNYIDAAADFHRLGVPVIADHMGGLNGLSLMAFGAASGIAHGVTLGERFSASAWKRPKSGNAFAPARRVYMADLDMLLAPSEAAAVMSSQKGRSLCGCRDTHCCRRGVVDMLEEPGRHFLVRRMAEVGELSVLPESVRAERFVERRLRTATDRALAAANLGWEDPIMAKKMSDHRKRLDRLRIALGALSEGSRPRSVASLPQTLAARLNP